VAKVPTFDARAPRRQHPAVTPIRNSGASFAAIAAVSGQFAAQMGQLADRAAAHEGRQAGLLHGGTARLPGGDLATQPIGSDETIAGPDVAARHGKPGLDRHPGTVKSTEAQLIVQSAARMGISPLDLANVYSFETSGTFSTSIRGGKNNNHIGLIQFGKFESKKYGAHQGQSFADQVLAAERYLVDRGIKPGMGLLDLYSTINAGRPGRYNASDAPGKTVRTHVAKMRGAHRRKAQEFLAGAVTISASKAAPTHVVRTADASGATFQTTGGFTIRSQNFDRAARSVFSDRLDTQMRGDIAELTEQHATDPDELAKAIDAYTAGRISGIEDVELRTRAEGLAGRLKLGAVRHASQNFDRQYRAEAQAAFADSFTARRTDLIRLARTAGEDEAANNAIAAELAGIEEFIDGQDALSPQRRQKLRSDLTQDVYSARVLGRFGRIEDPAARVAFQQEFEKQFNTGTGDAENMMPETFRKINAGLIQQLRADKQQTRAQIKLLDRQADQMKKRLEAGHKLPEGELAALKSRAAVTGDPVLAEAVKFLDSVVNWQSVNRQATPADIGAQIKVMQDQMDEHGATPEAVEMLGIMQGLKKNITLALRNDPLGHAERVDLIEVPDLDLSSTDALAGSLVVRASVAEQVSESFNIQPTYFKPGEVDALQKQITEDPLFLPVFASSLSDAFGERDTGPALAEISQTAPLISHAAGVAMSTGSDAILMETSQAITNRALPDFKPVTLQPHRQASLTREALGPALQQLPALSASAMQQAGLLFEVRAHRTGIDPTDTTGDVTQLWNSSLQDALGQHETDGEVRGGVAEINGQLTLIPPEMSAETVQTLLDEISQEHLDHLVDIQSANGLPIDPARIAGGTLVAAGHGQYFVALGNAQGADPQWLMGKDGQRWQLDIFTLAAIGQVVDPAPGFFESLFN